MSMRRLLQVGVMALALGGALVPMYGTSQAQVTTGTDRTTTADDDGPDFGWIGIFGLAGLAGLLGNRRSDTMTRHTSATSAAR
jgi:MYXO-CTERM domain-containing protein